MASIDRTAYPRFRGQLTDAELETNFTLSALEEAFVRRHARGDLGRLSLAVILKTRRWLGYFPALTEVPEQIQIHIADSLGLGEQVERLDGLDQSRTLYRYRQAIRTHLGSRPFSHGGREIVIIGSRSRKNRLYLAFRELGRVVRTLFLLRFVSEAELRQSIRAETTKIESHNDFLDWIGFGGPVIKSGDPVEQLKQVKYMELIANAVMLHNVVDLTDVLANMAGEGLPVTRELVARTAPTIREHLRRLGQYDVDMEDLPAPLRPGTLPILGGGS